MNFFRDYINYLKDNPNNYWFKRKLYGWGWVPVKWQGLVIIVVAITIVVAGIYIGDYDDAPGVALLGFIFGLGLIFVFGYWKGEKPQWKWGLNEEEKQNQNNQ